MEKADPKELAAIIFRMVQDGLTRAEIMKGLNLTYIQYTKVCNSRHFFILIKKSPDGKSKEEQISRLERRLWQLIENYNDPEIKVPDEDRAHAMARIERLSNKYATFLL